MTSAQRRAQVLDVGRTVFAERGLDGATVEEIAARCGVSKPVVYEHFGGKDGLYAVVVDREVQSLLTSFTSALVGHSPRELLEQATLALLTYVEECADGFRILVREPISQDSKSTGGTSSSGFSTLISDVAGRVEHLLDEQLAARGFRTAFTGLYAQALVGQVALVGQWWLDRAVPLEHGGPGRDEVAAHLVNLAWNGLSALEVEPRPVRGATPQTRLSGS